MYLPISQLRKQVEWYSIIHLFSNISCSLVAFMLPRQSLSVSPLPIGSLCIQVYIMSPNCPQSQLMLLFQQGSWLPGWVSVFIFHDAHPTPTQIFPWYISLTSHIRKQASPERCNPILMWENWLQNAAVRKGSRTSRARRRSFRKTQWEGGREWMPETNWTCFKLPLSPFSPFPSFGALK